MTDPDDLWRHQPEPAPVELDLQPVVRVVTTEQVVACVPPEHDCFRILGVRLRRDRWSGRWTVSVMGDLVNAEGDRHQGPSDEVDTFTEQEAIALAARIAPTLTVNGMSVADALERDEARRG